MEAAAGGWTAAPLPATPSLPTTGAAPIVAMSVVGQDPSVAVATDGLAVFRTADGGCTWKTVYTLGAADYFTDNGSVSAYTITNIANSHDATPSNHQDVYLALTPNGLNAWTLVTLFGAAPPELFAVSHDGGQTFAIETPQPTTANAFVPECLSTPRTFFAAPTDSKSLFLLCGGGAAQQTVDAQLVGNPAVTIYRSSDGGLSWTLRGLPYYSVSGSWFVPGARKNELWVGGYGLSGPHLYPAVWRSLDSGATWTMLLADHTPINPVGSNSTVQVAVDSAPGSGFGQIVAYSSVGTYVSGDSGKHWRRMRGPSFTNGSRIPVAAFFLHHLLYVMYASQLSCRDLPQLMRYPTLGSKSASWPYPSKWGTYAGWAVDATFAVVGRGLVGTGVASFCAPGATSPTTTKLLDLRVR